MIVLRILINLVLRLFVGLAATCMVVLDLISPPSEGEVWMDRLVPFVMGLIFGIAVIELSPFATGSLLLDLPLVIAGYITLGSIVFGLVLETPRLLERRWGI